VAPSLLKSITLHPGDVVLGERGDTLSTLLGSCVSIILTDPRRTVGVMSHVVHTSSGRVDTDTTAFGEAAMRAMTQLLQGRGIQARLCEAFVFGGGNMFPQLQIDLTVGDNNIAWAMRALQIQGIKVLSVDVGGSAYRRLQWTVGSEAPRVVAVPM
jgi:chemotaxis protein CheD